MKNVSPNKSWAAQHFPLLSGAILAPTQALTTLPRSSPGIPLKPSNMGKRKPKVIYEPNSLENVSPNPSWADQHSHGSQKQSCHLLKLSRHPPEALPIFPEALSTPLPERSPKVMPCLLCYLCLPCWLQA